MFDASSLPLSSKAPHSSNTRGSKTAMYSCKHAQTALSPAVRDRQLLFCRVDLKVCKVPVNACRAATSHLYASKSVRHSFQIWHGPLSICCSVCKLPIVPGQQDLLQLYDAALAAHGGRARVVPPQLLLVAYQALHAHSNAESSPSQSEGSEQSAQRR